MIDKPILNKKRGFAAIGIFSPKREVNIGGALRAAHCYDAAVVMIEGARYSKMPTDCSRAFRQIPLFHVKSLVENIPYDCVPVAVEMLSEAKSLLAYHHPKSAFYIFGGEDVTLGRAIVSKCRDVVYIPTKFCMNLAATVNVVLYDRLMKQDRLRG